MRRNDLIVFGILVGFFVFSCASSPKESSPKESPPEESQPTVANPYRPLSEMSNVTVIGTVQIQNYRTGVNREVTENGISSEIQKNNNAIYFELLRVAQEQYGSGGDIDIADIIWIPSSSAYSY